VVIHSKVVVVDERFLRVGSSNFNHRSEGLDTECDVAIEATCEKQAAAIARIRSELMAEHLGVVPHEFERALAETGSIVAALDRLNTHPRGLRPFDHVEDDGATGLVWGTGFVDPPGPVRPFYRTRLALVACYGQVFALLAKAFGSPGRSSSAIEMESKPSGSGRKK
jgi:phosphatidylserine/phosphatidylglycerophosphate/cardiolipin synthase-like enzyme